MGRYDRVTYQGKTFDRYTVAHFHAMLKTMRVPYDLSFYQGSYNGGVGASAGTHDGGGAFDGYPYQHDRKVKASRKNGGATWYRPAIAGLWGAHWHGVLIGNVKASPSAKRQIVQYRNHTNGLASYGWDSFWRPKTIRAFKYRRPLVSWRRLNRISRHKGGKAYTRSGQIEVELLYRALAGFNFDMRGHRRGHYDATMKAAIKRLQALKFDKVTEHGTVGPKTLAVLCIPHKAGMKGKPKDKKKPRINRARVNRCLRHPGWPRSKEDKRQLWVVRRALDRKGVDGDGLRERIRRFQRRQDWSGKGANGLLGPETCKRLGIRSRWRPLAPVVRKFTRNTTKTVDIEENR